VVAIKKVILFLIAAIVISGCNIATVPQKEIVYVNQTVTDCSYETWVNKVAQCETENRKAIENLNQENNYLQEELSSWHEWSGQLQDLSPQVDFDYDVRVSGSRVIIDYGKTVFLVQTNGKWWINSDSFSMRPTFDYEDVLIAYEPSSKNDIHKGDIVAFYDGNKLIVHRVVDIKGGLYFTKGDSNYEVGCPAITTNQVSGSIDSPFTFDKIEYKVIGVLWR